MSDLKMNDRIEELSDEELNRVFGGLNPQPLPPSHDTHAIKVSDNGYRIHAFRFW